MDETRPILYGVADYAELRKANAWFVDRTAKIRDLEATRYAVANPTGEHGKYLVLRFDFSAVSKNVAEVQDSFNTYAALRCDTFAREYANRLPEGLADRIFKASGACDKLNEIVAGLEHTGIKLYVMIDEYDNFANTILAESGERAYGELCHGGGFFKQFFAILKTATSDTDAPVTRLFITGVSPVTMDDVTSGFNIGTNISLDPQFADLTGFRHDDLRAIADYYAPHCGFDADKAYNAALAWYDNYRFGSANAPAIANTTLVLSLFSLLWRTKRFPDDFIDENLRTDYAKIRHLITADRRLNGNFHVLENLLAGGALEERLVKSFQAKELSQKENFTSLLYWLGITTITGAKFGKMTFGVPNETLKELAAKMIPAAYADIHKIDERVYGINDGLCKFAEDGDWRGFVGILAGIVKENFAVRDSVEGEKVVQSTLVALLCAAGGPYFVRHEREAGGGFYDIALAPQLSRWPEIAHAALIEMKYVKVGDPAPTAEALAKTKAEAIRQLDQYSADHDIATEWRLGASRTPRPTTGTTGVSPVALHRLVLVFHGGDCVLSEEV